MADSPLRSVKTCRFDSDLHMFSCLISLHYIKYVHDNFYYYLYITLCSMIYFTIEVKECLLLYGAELLPWNLLSKDITIKVYRTVILPVVLYVCKTWFLTLREEYRLREFENVVQRRLFGPKRDEVTGEWRRICNNEHYALYSSPNIIRVMKSRALCWHGM